MKYYFIYIKFPESKKFMPYNAKENRLEVNKIHASMFNEKEVELVLEDLIKNNPEMKIEKRSIKS